MIIYTILFGMSTFKWNYSEYVTMLSVMGFLTGATLFCWIVVFTFRKNLLMVAKYSLAPTAQSTGSIYTSILIKLLFVCVCVIQFDQF